MKCAMLSSGLLNNLIIYVKQLVNFTLLLGVVSRNLHIEMWSQPSTMTGVPGTGGKEYRIKQKYINFGVK